MYETTLSVHQLASAKSDAQAALARSVTASCSYVQEASRRPWASGAVFDVDAAEACAVAEVAAALSVSQATVTEWPFLTRTARPAVLDAFRAGRLAYAAFRTVCRSLADVPHPTEDLLRRVIGAAERCTPGAVAAAIDRVLAEFDADWHRVARERAATERYVSVRKLPRGQAELKVRGPAEQIAGMKRAVVEAARGVCATDPRPLPAILFDATHALLTGGVVSCSCADDRCPHRAPLSPTPTNRAVIVLDAATAAGLAGEPGHLVGWGPVPADVARRIAADATWQALITEGRASTTRDCSCRCPEHDPPDREVRRTRRFPPGWTPLQGRVRTTRIRNTLEEAEYLRGQPPAVWNRAVDDPGGHGGVAVPPAGALTYRPSEAVAALVTALYPVCVHPGCAVPSEDCDLDHVVPFDHADPLSGGWTVAGNLQPLCRRHHGLKTRGQWQYRKLRNGIVHIRDSQGNDYLTAPGE